MEGYWYQCDSFFSLDYLYYIHFFLSVSVCFVLCNCDLLAYLEAESFIYYSLSRYYVLMDLFSFAASCEQHCRVHPWNRW